MKKNFNRELKKIILEKFLNEAAAISNISTSGQNITKDIKQKIFSILSRAFGPKTSFGDETVNQNKYYKKFFNDIISYVEKDRMNKYLGEIRNAFISRHMESNNGQIPSQQQIEDKINKIKDDTKLNTYFRDAGINDLDDFLKNNLKLQVDNANTTTEAFHNYILKNVSKFAKSKIKNMFQGIKLELVPKKIELTFDKDIKIGDLKNEINSLKNKTNPTIQEKYLLLFYKDLDKIFNFGKSDIGKFFKYTSNANQSKNKPVPGYINSVNDDQEIILNGKKIVFQQIPESINDDEVIYLNKVQFFKTFNIDDNYFENKDIYNTSGKKIKAQDVYKIDNGQKSLILQNNIELSIKDSKREIDLEKYIEEISNITIAGGNDIFTSILKKCLGFTDRVHGIEKFLENDYDITKIENIEIKGGAYKNTLLKLDKKIKDYFSINNQKLNELLILDKSYSEILFDFNEIKIGNLNFEEFLKTDITFNNILIKKINNLDANMSYNAPEFDSSGKQKLVTQNEKFINHFIEIDTIDQKKYITLDNIFALIIIKIFCNANEFMFEIYYILSRLQVAIAYRFNELYSSINLISSTIDDTQKNTTQKINISIDGSYEEFDPKQHGIEKKVAGTPAVVSDDNKKFDDFIEFLNKKTNLYNNIVPLKTDSYTKITLDDIKKSLGLMDDILIDGVDYGYQNIVSDQIILLLYNRKDYGLGAGEHLLILYLLGVNVGNLILNKIIKSFRSRYTENTQYETKVSDMLNYFHSDQQDWYQSYTNNISTAIEEILKSYFIYSGGTEHGDINFKKSLPTGIKSANDINKKIFETKKIEGLSSEFRVGSQGIRALSKFTPKIIECGEIINDLINDDNLYQNKNLNKILLSEILASLSSKNVNNVYEANIKFLNKYFPKSGHQELPSLFETEGATYNGFQAGGQKFSNISNLVTLKSLIQKILEDIIKEYHHGTQKFTDKDGGESVFGTIAGPENWVGGKSVYILDNSKKEGEFTFPIDIHSKKPENEADKKNNILLTIDSHDIINLIRDHEIRDDVTSHDEKKKKIKKAFKLDDTVNEIHIEILTLAVKYYNRLRRIDLREIEKNISNVSYVKPSDCFTGIDYLIISNYSEPSSSSSAKKSTSEMLTFYFIPINKLDDYLTFTSTSQLRPQFKLKGITI